MAVRDAKFGEFTDGGIFSLLALNVIVAVILTLIFLVFRGRHRRVYWPRLKERPSSLLFGPAPPPDVLLEDVGLEGFFYLSTLRTLYALSFVVALVTAPLLIPVNNSGRFNLDQANALVQSGSADLVVSYRTGFSNWTSRNIGPEDPVLWIHLVCLLVISLVSWGAIGRLFVDFAVARRRHRGLVAQGRTAAPLCTALVQGLPEATAGAEAVFSALAGAEVVEGGVAGVTLPPHRPKAVALAVQAEELRAKLAHARELVAENPGQPKPTVRVPALCGKKRDMVLALEAQLGDAEARASAEVARAGPTSRSAFVRFKSEAACARFVRNMECRAARPVPVRSTAEPGRVAALLVSLGLADVTPPGHEGVVLAVSLAPDRPEDVIFNNLRIQPPERAARGAVFLAVTTLLVTLWAIPVALLSSLETLPGLPGVGKAFAPLLRLPPALLSLLATVLPIAVVVVFNMLLPKILAAITRGEGCLTAVELRASVLGKFFVFQLFSVLILPSVFVGSMAQLAQIGANIADRPVKAILDLVTAITTPTTGVYAGLLIQLALTGCFLRMCGVVPLVVGAIKTKLAKTARARDEAYAVAPCDFHLEAPGPLVVFAIGMAFAITMPITTPCMFLFFQCKFLVERYRLTAVVPPGRPGLFKSGLMCVRILGCLSLALIILQVGTAGFFFSKRAIGQGVISLLLVVPTVLSARSIRAAAEDVLREDFFVFEGQEVKVKGEGVGVEQGKFVHPAMKEVQMGSEEKV
jgi:hypothetical protein